MSFEFKDGLFILRNNSYKETIFKVENVIAISESQNSTKIHFSNGMYGVVSQYGLYEEDLKNSINIMFEIDNYHDVDELKKMLKQEMKRVKNGIWYNDGE